MGIRECGNLHDWTGRVSVTYMTRVWLTKWEWECCGDPFGVGDEVDFGIESRTAYPALAEILGPEVIATVAGMESHHVEEFCDRVRGRVVSVYAVTREVIERRSLRRPSHGAPLDATMPADGGDWPIVAGGREKGASWGTRPSRYVTQVVPLPGTATLAFVHGVRQPASDHSHQLPSASDLAADPPPERTPRELSGWLVDVEEQAQELR